MATLTERPIVKSWGEDTANKDSPSQTQIGDGIDYGSLLTSAEPNGALYILFEAVKNLQRTGGMYSEFIPYGEGQSCSVLCKQGSVLYIRRFVATYDHGAGVPPINDATITTINGVSCYSGGTVSGYWRDADSADGWHSLPSAGVETPIPYNGVLTQALPAFASVMVGDRQYVNPSSSASPGTTNPELLRASYYTRALDIEEVLRYMETLYLPAFTFMETSVATYPLRRLGVYKFRGATVEAFGLFLSGQSFTDDGTSNRSKFWRSFSSSYASQCIISRPTFRDQVFSGTAGGTITPRDYRGRVQACAGTATLSSGTSEPRASLGEVQDDQMQGHANRIQANESSIQSGYTLQRGGNILGASSGNSVTYGGDNPGANFITTDNIADPTHGTPRVGYNTREATFTGPVPMVVSLLPYGEITL